LTDTWLQLLSDGQRGPRAEGRSAEGEVRGAGRLHDQPALLRSRAIGHPLCGGDDREGPGRFAARGRAQEAAGTASPRAAHAQHRGRQLHQPLQRGARHGTGNLKQRRRWSCRTITPVPTGVVLRQNSVRSQVVDQSALIRRESRPMIALLLHLLRLLPFLCGGHRQLALENLALRQQLAVYKRTTNRPRLRRSDRVLWVWLSRVWPAWRQALVIVAPATVRSWQRRRFRRHWATLSGRPPAGRPPVDAAIKALVRSMAAANPLWGAPRIHGELLKLGIDVAERTVSRLLQKRRSPPSQTWRTFLTNHVRDLVSVDFFTVPTARRRVLFVFVVLAHDRRRVLHFNVTGHP